MEKSTGRFAKYFKKVLEEDMTTGDAGVGSTGDGFAPNNSTSSDSYAPGDARVPKVLGKIQTRIKKKKKKKAKKVHLPSENEEDNVIWVDDISDYM